MNQIKRLCVNCGSNPGANPDYMRMAETLGKTLVDHQIDLVYGGADVGLMGAVANAVIAGGGKVIGVIPKSLADKVSHRGLNELHIVESMHARKKMMAELSDGVIALPGGFGTLEEITEILTWAQLGLNNNPCGLINVAGYYDKLLSFLDHAVDQGFIKNDHKDMLLVEERPDLLIEKFYSYTSPALEKWG
jgi:uncharacterized protein (TIGR00730 family)